MSGSLSPVTGASWGLLAAAAAVAVVDWVAVARRHKPTEYAAKPGALALLLGVALALDPTDDGQRAWVVAALALSLAGDVFLMLPRDLFVPGLASFLLAHVAYVVALLAERDNATGLVVGAALVAVATVAIGRRILRAADPALRGPVAGYMLAIGAMVAAAFGTGEAAAVTGAVLFYTSDGLLAWDRFEQPFAAARLLVMVTYHLGQAALVLSLTT